MRGVSDPTVRDLDLRRGTAFWYPFGGEHGAPRRPILIASVAELNTAFGFIIAWVGTHQLKPLAVPTGKFPDSFLSLVHGDGFFKAHDIRAINVFAHHGYAQPLNGCLCDGQSTELTLLDDLSTRLGAVLFGGKISELLFLPPERYSIEEAVREEVLVRARREAMIKVSQRKDDYRHLQWGDLIYVYDSARRTTLGPFVVVSSADFHRLFIYPNAIAVPLRLVSDPQRMKDPYVVVVPGGNGRNSCYELSIRGLRTFGEPPFSVRPIGLNLMNLNAQLAEKLERFLRNFLLLEKRL